MPTPLFVCHANCCRSVLAHYLYEHLHPGASALSAGMEPGTVIAPRAVELLRAWGTHDKGHVPRQFDRALCDQADAIFFMGPEYLRWALFVLGSDLASKSYLFADPFSLPADFSRGQYLVWDPSFDHRPVSEILRKVAWMRERVGQISQALHGEGPLLVPARAYLRALAR
jgi:hypothetical protein